MYIVSKDSNVVFIVMRPPKTQSQNLKYRLGEMGRGGGWDHPKEVQNFHCCFFHCWVAKVPYF